MALADPQSITVAGVGKSMPRVETSGLSSKYAMADDTYKLFVSHQVSKNKIRSVARFVFRAIVADPLTAANDYEESVVQVIFERPEVGFSATQVKDQTAGLFTWLNAAMVDKLYGRES
jgi:hypothetical protein